MKRAIILTALTLMASAAYAAPTVNGSRGATEGYLTAFNSAAGIDTNVNFGFGDSAKSEQLNSTSDSSSLYVMVEGSLHSGNKLFVLIDSDNSNATGFSGGHPDGAFGESNALEFFTDFPDGGYDLMVEVTANGNPATNLDVVVFSYDSAGALVDESYAGNIAGLSGSLNDTIRSISANVDVAMVNGDGAGDGIEIKIPKSWLLYGGVSGGSYQLVTLNGNGGNNFWSDSTIPQLTASGNIGFTPGPDQGRLTALTAPDFTWPVFVDGTGDGDGNSVDDYDSISAALVAMSAANGNDTEPDLIKVMVNDLPNHPGIMINGGTTTAPGGTPPFAFPGQPDDITIDGDGDGDATWARVQLAAGTAGTAVSPNYSFITARFVIELAIDQRVTISNFTFMPQNLGVNGGQTTNAASDGGTRMNFMYVDEAVANLTGTAADTGLTLTNVLVTGSTSAGLPVDPNAAPVADGTYWASDASFVGAIAFASHNTGINNFVHNLDNVTIGHTADVCHGLGIYCDPFTGTGTINISNSSFLRAGVAKPTIPAIAASARNGIQISSAENVTVNLTNVACNNNNNHGLNASVVSATANGNTYVNINAGSQFNNNTFRGASFTSTGATTTNARNRVSINGTSGSPVVVQNNGNRGIRTENANSASATQFSNVDYLRVIGNGVYGIEFNEFDFQYPTVAGPTFSNCIFHDNGNTVAETSNVRIADTNAAAGGASFNDCTFHDPRLNGASPGLNVVIGFTGTTLLTLNFTDCIFSGSQSSSPQDQAIAILNGSNNTVNLNNCSVVENGTGSLDKVNKFRGFPNAVTSGTGNALNQTAVIARDPLYAGYDPTLASYLDVTSPQYAGAGSAASNLSGGADYIGGAAVGDIDLTATSFDFGPVVSPATPTQTFTLSNTGGVEVNVTSLGFTGADAGVYSLVSPPTTPFLLASGVPVTLTVQFAPVAVVNYNDCFLSVGSDDGDEPTVTSDLDGQGASAINNWMLLNEE